MKINFIRIYYCTIAILLNGNLKAQTPGIEWEKCLGGGYGDYAWSVKSVNDGGYVVVGYSESNDGDIDDHFGNPELADYWIVKLDSAGKIKWKKSLGGSYLDQATCIQQDVDDNYVIAGSSASIDGNITNNHGGLDYWIIKLDGDGNLLWQRSFGGENNDYCYSMQLTRDKGYILAGFSESNTGDFTSNHGRRDYWVIKLDSTTNMQWQKSFGGSLDDEAYSVDTTWDGGFIVAGRTSSNDFDVTFNHGKQDFWVIKLDSSGSLIWQKTFGGTGIENAFSVKQTSGSNYIVAGYTNSNDMDVSGKHFPLSAYEDFWIINLNDSGKINWQKCYGGDFNERAFSIQNTSDGGYLIAGLSESTNGDLNENAGGDDYCVIKTDSIGTLKWQKSIGGKSVDYALSVEPAKKGGYIVAGFTGSSDLPDYHSNKTGTAGDYWVIKLEVDPVTNVNKGVWSNPATWNNNKVPDQNTHVYLSYDVTIDENAKCKSLKTNSFVVHINKNIGLTVTGSAQNN